LKATIVASPPSPHHRASQSWIDPGADPGGEDGRTGLVPGASVAGAASDGAGILDIVLGGGPDFMAGILDVVLGGGSDFMAGVATRLSSCLWGGLNRVNGGLLGGRGWKTDGGATYGLG
jgi:hypothetical protein